ncbi:PAS domain-containing protein [Candidatus Kuenenbacteria bacterium]|nr:PAS domain-containing protein [Candidatus Kuenenbacteria bacterium]
MNFFKQKKCDPEEVIKYQNSLAELDKIAKMLIKRDLALSDSKEKLTVEKGKVDAVINSLTDGLIMIDQGQRIILINPKAQSILNIEEEKIIGKALSELINFPQIKELYEILTKTAGHCREKQCELILKESVEKIFEMQTTLVVTEAQEIIGTLIILHDVTRERLINKIKSEFITIAAHQLRTPLTGIKWSLEMINTDEITKEEQKEFLDKAYQSNERMIRLVNSLLIVSHLEEGCFVYKFSKIQMEDLIQEIIENFKIQIKNKNIECIFDKPKILLPKIKVDLERIQMALENLIDNAIKYTPQKGKIIISLKESDNKIEVSIKDTGMGISKENQERLFTKFFRSAEALKIETSGSGLGLFIAKNIIEAHKGQIWVESEEGKGSEFHFSLPY